MADAHRPDSALQRLDDAPLRRRDAAQRGQLGNLSRAQQPLGVGASAQKLPAFRFVDVCAKFARPDRAEVVGQPGERESRDRPLCGLPRRSIRRATPLRPARSRAQQRRTGISPKGLRRCSTPALSSCSRITFLLASVYAVSMRTSPGEESQEKPCATQQRVVVASAIAKDSFAQSRRIESIHQGLHR
jgi:hypothetical protein